MKIANSKSVSFSTGFFGSTILADPSIDGRTLRPIPHFNKQLEVLLINAVKDLGGFPLIFSTKQRHQFCQVGRLSFHVPSAAYGTQPCRL